MRRVSEEDECKHGRQGDKEMLSKSSDVLNGGGDFRIDPVSSSQSMSLWTGITH
jgi:hypothetical protein